jgi:glycosyltransferase involved in cell wall biosynthesis
MRHPLVSIIIPSLNQGKFIDQTLESIFLQDYPNLEVIVMDGGSTDGTVKTLKKYELRVTSNELRKHRIFTWISKKDKGQADAINKGMKKAHGDIVTYINSDDYYLPHAIKTVVSYFLDYPNVDWLTGDCMIVDEYNNRIQSFVRWYKKILRMLPIQLILPVANPIAQPSTFWRKKVFEEIGHFDDALRYVFDYEYWIRIAKKYTISVIPHVLSAFRIHRASKGGSNYKKQFEEELEVSHTFHTPRFFQFFHKIHAKIVIWIYNRIK